MVRALAALILLLAAHPVLAQSDDGDHDSHRHHGGGARILVLRDYHLDAGQTARGPIVVFGGSARIDGHADDDVVVLGGSLDVGPQAEIDGDVVMVGGNATIDSQARVHGEINETVMQFPIDGHWGNLPPGFFAGLALLATLLRLLSVFAVAAALTLIAPAWVRGISSRAGDGPGTAAAIGLLCQMAYIPTLLVVIAVLAVTVIGIPLIGAVPFLVAASAVVATAGFTAVAARIGARVRGTTVEASSALFLDVLIGFALVSAVSVFAQVLAFGPSWSSPVSWGIGGIGLLIEYTAWTVGMGAACATMLARWNGPMAAPATPPPMPPAAPAPTVV